MSDFGDFGPEDAADDADPPDAEEAARRQRREGLFVVVRAIFDPIHRKRAAKAAVSIFNRGE